MEEILNYVKFLGDYFNYMIMTLLPYSPYIWAGWSTLKGIVYLEHKRFHHEDSNGIKLLDVFYPPVVDLIFWKKRGLV